MCKESDGASFKMKVVSRNNLECDFIHSIIATLVRYRTPSSFS